MVKKVAAFVAVVGAVIGLQVGVASAHVVVRPAEVETAAFQTFTTSVPNEKDVPTVKVRLVMPDGLGHVTPTVKPGWNIETVKEGEGEEAVVKEIIWSGGSIPVGQRDDFTFSAQAPEQVSTLQWKAYQTYEGGEEVAWDQAPGSGGHDGSTPYSETKVVENLASNAGVATSGKESGNDSRSSMALVLSAAALVLAVFTFTRLPKAAGKDSSKDSQS